MKKKLGLLTMHCRFMRIILYFDLPTLTTKNQKDYRLFIKHLKKGGFYMLQESVYVKMVTNYEKAKNMIGKVKEFLPSEGNVMILVITEKQFSKMEILLGENQTDKIENLERVVTL